ncbi:SymE family type I addiction module toxin [Chitinophaga sp.]|uniref:SymE family type I addiction module toxin n=1 Tax=Chitinophaga sp. TaxID=1869181 RepID=UPI0026396DE8|nr:SymE family type I addiction module toxin [uncultured Chitinophaga sp.]
MKSESKHDRLFPTRHLTVSRKPGSNDTTSLMLAGKWLKDAGFTMGAIVRLEVWEDKIIIHKTDKVWVEEERIITKRMMVNKNTQKNNFPKPRA